MPKVPAKPLAFALRSHRLLTVSAVVPSSASIASVLIGSHAISVGRARPTAKGRTRIDCFADSKHPPEAGEGRSAFQVGVSEPPGHVCTGQHFACENMSSLNAFV